jgi:hypothetical protein
MQDTFGYAVAIAMVAKSCLKGRYEDYQQYETMRKLRMGFSSEYMSSPLGMQAMQSTGGDVAKL